MYGATPRCPRCEKAVYAAEQVLGPGRKFYHKPCLSCKICRRRLDSYNLLEHDEEAYCKPCHVKNFGTRDLRHQNLPLAPRPRSSSSASSSPPSPPPVQQSLAPVRPLSVSTTGTNALLRPTRALSPTVNSFPRPRPKSMSSSDSGSGSGSQSRRSSLHGSEAIPEEPERASLSSVAHRLTENSEGTDLSKATTTSTEPEIDFSKATITPIRSNTGRSGGLPRTVPLPLDYGAHLSRHRSTQSIDGPVKTHNTSSSISSTSSVSSSFAARGATMDAISLLEQEGIMNPLQGSPTGGRFPMPLNRSATTRSPRREDGQITTPLQQSPTGTRYGTSLNRATTLSSQTTGSPRKWGGSTPQCPACSKNVYFAEQVKAVGKTYHKSCLRCTECRTGLDSTRLRDHDGIPFCVRCYGKLYGPQGHGYALLGKAGG